jgi:hypothetical protein
MSATRCGFPVFKNVRVLRKNDGSGATHGAPVVSEGGAADEANLVVLPVRAAVRPGKTVRAEVLNQPLEETGHTYSCSLGDLARVRVAFLARTESRETPD